MTRMTRHIQIVVDKNRGKQLDAIARQKGFPTATLIRSVLYQFLDKYQN